MVSEGPGAARLEYMLMINSTHIEVLNEVLVTPLNNFFLQKQVLNAKITFASAVFFLDFASTPRNHGYGNPANLFLYRWGPKEQGMQSHNFSEGTMRVKWEELFSKLSLFCRLRWSTRMNTWRQPKRLGGDTMLISTPGIKILSLERLTPRPQTCWIYKKNKWESWVISNVSNPHWFVCCCCCCRILVIFIVSYDCQWYRVSKNHNSWFCLVFPLGSV